MKSLKYLSMALLAFALNATAMAQDLRGHGTLHLDQFGRMPQLLSGVHQNDSGAVVSVSYTLQYQEAPGVALYLFRQADLPTPANVRIVFNRQQVTASYYDPFGRGVSNCYGRIQGNQISWRINNGGGGSGYFYGQVYY